MTWEDPSPRNDSGSKAMIRFSPYENALARVESDPENLIVLAFGVRWSFPSVKTLEHVAELATDSSRGIRVFIIDEERNFEVCQKYDIIVGTPAILIFHRKMQFTFHRKNRAPIKKYVGPLNRQQLLNLFDAASMTASQQSTDVYVE